MKLWKLTCCDKSTNAPISWSHYYYGEFQNVTDHINKEYGVEFRLDCSLSFNKRLWTLRQVNNFTNLEPAIHESLQANIVD